MPLRLLSTLLALLGLSIAPSCQGLQGGAPPRAALIEDLTAHPWRLARLERAFPVARTQSNFEFSADGRLEGNGGAAEFFGRFSLDPGGYFEITMLQSMLLGLPSDSHAPGAPTSTSPGAGPGSQEELISQQERLESLLRQIDRIEIWRNRLLLSTRGRTHIELAPADR